MQNYSDNPDQPYPVRERIRQWLTALQPVPPAGGARRGCERDYNNDGNCDRHPNGCPPPASEPGKLTPISDLAVKCHAEICEAIDAHFSPRTGAIVERRIQSAIDAALSTAQAEIARLTAENGELKASANPQSPGSSSARKT